MQKSLRRSGTHDGIHGLRFDEFPPEQQLAQGRKGGGIASRRLVESGGRQKHGRKLTSPNGPGQCRGPEQDFLVDTDQRRAGEQRAPDLEGRRVEGRVG